MKLNKKGLLAAAVICSVLAAPAPSYAYKDYYDETGMPCLEYACEGGNISYTLEKPITIHVDGEYLPSDVDATIRSGRTLVPLRAAGEALGAQVNWDQGTQTAIAVKDGRTVQFQLYSQTYYINGQAYYTDVAPTMINNRTLHPLRVFAEALAADVYWDQNTYDVQIDTPAQDVTTPALPASITGEEAEWVKKYYVAADPSDPLVGTWFSANIQGNQTTDRIKFVSKYNGKYQTTMMIVEKTPSRSKPWITLKRDNKTMHYTQNGADVYVFNIGYELLYYRGPGRGGDTSYHIMSLAGNTLTEIGIYSTFGPGNYSPLTPEYRHVYTKII